MTSPQMMSNKLTRADAQNQKYSNGSGYSLHLSEHDHIFRFYSPTSSLVLIELKHRMIHDLGEIDMKLGPISWPKNKLLPRPPVISIVASQQEGSGFKIHWGPESLLVHVLHAFRQILKPQITCFSMRWYFNLVVVLTYHT